MILSRSRLKVLILSILFILILGLTSVADTLSEKVDKLFTEWDKPDSPGCALGIIKEGKLIYKRGYGMANLEYNIPISSQSVFRIGSTSKQFTAMCVLLLDEQGKLSLDDDVRKYIPEMPEYEKPITIRHLIHHTSGIRDYLTLKELAGERDDDFYIDGEVVDLLTHQKELNFNPGDEFLYSNSGYFLLSIIVKKAAGKSLHEFAEENIFKPLALRSTHFHNDHTMIVKNRAIGYAPVKSKGFRINTTTLDMIGDGGIFTTVDDLFLWDQNFYENKLGKLSQDLIKRMLTPGRLNNGEKLDYAFGLMVNDYRGLKMVSHGGSFVGYRAEMIRFPEQRFSVICLANLSSINPSKLAREVADIYLGDQFRKDNKEKMKPPEKPQFIQVPESELKDKTGAFRDPKSGSIWKLSIKEGKLWVDTSVFVFSLLPLSRTRFLTVDAPVEMEIEFETRDKDKPLLIHVKSEERESSTFEAIRLVSPTQEQLEEYVGNYYSEELQTTYKVVLEKGNLFLRHSNPHKNYPDKPLEPTLQDMFMVSGIQLKFFRNEQNEVTSYKVNAGRVKNIRFIKEIRQDMFPDLAYIMFAYSPQHFYPHVECRNIVNGVECSQAY